MPGLVQINVSANWGSHGRIAECIGNEVLAHGWSSCIAYGRGMNPSRSGLIRVGNGMDVYLHVAETRLLDNHGLASRSATRRLIHTLEEMSPDIIHLHNIHGYYLNYRLLFQYLAKIHKPVVWTFHDSWPVTGHCAFPDVARCERWKGHCTSPCPLKADYPCSWLWDGSGRNFEIKKQAFNQVEDLHIVTVSRWLESQVRESFLKDCDIRCIYNGVDTSAFRPCLDTRGLWEKHGIRPGEKVVLGVASVWESRKGLGDFYRLREVLPAHYRILLIGLDAKQAKDLPAGIDGVGRTESLGELAAYYNMADVYVNPSVAESFGMTTAESLSCGTPAVVYDVTACPEVVDDKTGRVIKLGDTCAMASAVQGICEGPDKESIGAACRKRAEELFDARERYREYFDLYNSLLGRR